MFKKTDSNTFLMFTWNWIEGLWCLFINEFPSSEGFIISMWQPSMAPIIFEIGPFSLNPFQITSASSLFVGHLMNVGDSSQIFLTTLLIMLNPVAFPTLNFSHIDLKMT